MGTKHKVQPRPHDEGVMGRSTIVYQVCDATPNGDIEPIGRFMYDTPEQAEREHRERQLSCPTAFLARVVFTRLHRRDARKHLRPVRG